MHAGSRPLVAVAFALEPDTFTYEVLELQALGFGRGLLGLRVLEALHHHRVSLSAVGLLFSILL